MDWSNYTAVLMQTTVGAIGLDTYPCGMVTMVDLDAVGEGEDDEITVSCYGELASLYVVYGLVSSADSDV